MDAGDGIKLSEQQVGMFNVTQSDKFKTEITDEGCLKNTLKGTIVNATIKKYADNKYKVMILVRREISVRMMFDNYYHALCVYALKYLSLC